MKYLLSRLAQALVIVVSIAVVVFFALRLTAGDPARLRAQIFSDESVLDQYRKDFGTDQPLYVQFFRFFGGLLRGDLGTSFRYETPVTGLLGPALLNTVVLGALALLLTFLLASLLGTLAARKPGGVVSGISSVIAVIGQSAPLFWVSLLLISLFSLNLGWFPPGGFEGPQSLVLPVIALTLGLLPSQMRVLNSSVRQELTEDYVRTARAFGLSETRIGFVYIYRNALLPLLTVIGNDMGVLLGGVIVAEVVFNFPGIGSLALTAMNSRDYPLIQGIVICAAAAFVLINLVVDLLYTVINPRVRLGGTR